MGNKFIKWDDIAADERYQSLDDSGRIAVASGYMKEFIEPDAQFASLPQRDKDRIKLNFYNSRDKVPGEEPESALARDIKEYPSNVALGYEVHKRDPKAAIETVMAPIGGAISDIQGAAEAGISLASMAPAFAANILSGVGELMNQAMAGGEDTEFDWGRVREKGAEVMEDIAPQPVTLKGQQTIAPLGEAFETAINTVADAITPEGSDENTLERNKFLVEAALVATPLVKKGIGRVKRARSVQEVAQVVKEANKASEGHLRAAVEKIEQGREVELTPQERYAAGTAGKLEIPKVEEPLVTPAVGLSTEVVKVEPTRIKAIDLMSDPEVKTRYKNAVIRQPGIIEIAKEELNKAVAATTRGSVSELPRGTAKERGFFATARDAIQGLNRQKGVAINKTIRALEAVTQDLVKAKDIEGYNLFSMKVLLDDLARESSAGRQLPYGYTPDILARDIAKVDMAVQSAPNVMAALERRGQLMEAVKGDYVKAMGDIGIDLSERMSNFDYFRHQVLDYVQAEGLYGTGQRLKAPTSRGFLKERKGSALDINRDYLQAESEVVSQMLYDTQVARTLKKIETKYDRSAEFKGKPIPEGYIEWQPREGSVFYKSYTIPEQVAMDALESGLSELAGKDVGKALVMGGRRKAMVIPVEIADALNGLTKQKRHTIGKDVLKKWKQWQLVSPRRVVKYNLRNITGDADAVFVGNPNGFKYTPKAAKELYDVLALKKSPSPELAEWLDRGGMEGTLQAQEMSTGLKKLQTFAKLYKPDEGGIAKAPVKGWHGYWNAVSGATNYREAILRYANYLSYKDQIAKSPEGKPANFGASFREEVMALDNPSDKAYKMANELLGAYDDIGLTGQALRERIIPFWSWNEVNMKRYKRFIQNAYADGKTTELLGRKLGGTAIKSPLIAMRIGKLAVKATALNSMLTVWNNHGVQQIYGEDLESQLPEKKRSRPHIILGRDDDGNIISFDRLGAFGDFIEWFGLDAAPRNIDLYLKGRKNVKEIAGDMAQSPVNKLWQGAIPFEKLGLEYAMGRTTYPDLWSPRTIRDKGQYIFGSFGLQNEYNAIMDFMGKPKASKPYMDTMINLITYKINPGEAAMGDVYEMRRDYMKRIGKTSEGFWTTPRGQALYNFKLGIKLKDEEAVKHYFGEFLRMSGGKTPQEINQSIKRSLDSMSPVYGISQEDMAGFIEYIGPEGIERVKQAMDYYNDIRTIKPPKEK